MHKEKLHNLYVSSNINQMMKCRNNIKMIGAFSRCGKDQKSIIGFGAKPKEKMPLGRPWCKMGR
jgi:hypothetical protein